MIDHSVMRELRRQAVAESTRLRAECPPAPPTPPPLPIYRFAATCPYDGGDAILVAPGTTNGIDTRAVCECADCGAHLLLTVSMSFRKNGHRATPAKREALARARASKTSAA